MVEQKRTKQPEVAAHLNDLAHLRLLNLGALNQRSSTLFLGTHYPEKFSYNPITEAANQALQDCLKIAGRCAEAGWK